MNSPVKRVFVVVLAVAYFVLVGIVAHEIGNTDQTGRRVLDLAHRLAMNECATARRAIARSTVDSGGARKLDLQAAHDHLSVAIALGGSTYRCRLPSPG